jgi:hypothetical protein
MNRLNKVYICVPCASKTFHHMQPHQRLATKIYFPAVFSGSLLSKLYTFPEHYFTNKRNFFNLVFVKNGWFWTLVTLIPLILIASNSIRYKKMAAIRIFSATIYFFIVAQIMNWVLFTTGGCSIEGISTLGVCKKEGGYWNGFDISGHCFLLHHSSFLIIEEMSRMKMPTKFGWKRTMFHILGVFSVLLLILWFFMLIITTLYFHPFLEILIGSIFGLLFWAAVYVFENPNFLGE